LVKYIVAIVTAACALNAASAQQTEITPLPPVPASDGFKHFRTPPAALPVRTAAALPVKTAATLPSDARQDLRPPVSLGAQGALAARRVDAPLAGSAVLPANTEVLLRLDEDVNSKRKRVGDSFRLTVLQDIMLGNYVVIPRGSPAYGQVSYRTGKGAFGKSAKMEVTMDSIHLDGRNIPITGNFREEGQGNTGATVGVAVAAGVFSAFVTGRSAVFQSGREFRVATREAMRVALPE
jgi:hypothetical protein